LIDERQPGISPMSERTGIGVFEADRSVNLYRTACCAQIGRLPARKREDMARLHDRLRPRMRRDDGASAVEYGLLVALLAVIIAGTVWALGVALQAQFFSVCETSASDPGAECE